MYCAEVEVQGLEELRIHLSALKLSAAPPPAAEAAACGRMPEEARRDTSEFKCFKLRTAGAGGAAGCPASDAWEVKELRTLPSSTLSATALLAGEACSCWLPWPERGGDCGSGGCCGMGSEVMFGSSHRSV